MKAKIKAYGYLRVSGINQAKKSKDGLPRQRTAIQKYAKDNGIVIEKYFEDKGVSGTIKDRPALIELLTILETNGNGIRTVLIEKVDRLARDLMIQESIIQDLKKKGFNIISVLEGDMELLNYDPTRNLIRQVMGAVAEYEKAMLVIKLRVARQRKKLKYGRCEGVKGYKDLQPDMVKLLRKYHRLGWKYDRILKELTKQGYKNLEGKPLSKHTLANIIHKIKNNLYIKVSGSKLK